MKWQLLSHAIRNCGGSSFATEIGIMKVLIATDAWRPQVNGVVRTLGALEAKSVALINMSVVVFTTSERFNSIGIGSSPCTEVLTG